MPRTKSTRMDCRSMRIVGLRGRRVEGEGLPLRDRAYMIDLTYIVLYFEFSQLGSNFFWAVTNLGPDGLEE